MFLTTETTTPEVWCTPDWAVFTPAVHLSKEYMSTEAITDLIGFWIGPEEHYTVVLSFSEKEKVDSAIPLGLGA